MTYWLYLTFAILFEVAGTTCMKLSDGGTKWVYNALILVFYLSSFALLTLAIKKIELSIAYAIWAGVGTALITMIGIFWFKEAVTTLKMVSVALIIIGVVGLKLGEKV